jgi:hypothetical protein
MINRAGETWPLLLQNNPMEDNGCLCTLQNHNKIITIRRHEGGTKAGQYQAKSWQVKQYLNWFILQNFTHKRWDKNVIFPCDPTLPVALLEQRF